MHKQFCIVNPIFAFRHCKLPKTSQNATRITEPYSLRTLPESPLSLTVSMLYLYLTKYIDTMACRLQTIYGKSTNNQPKGDTMTHIRFQSLTRGNDVGYLYDDSISADHSWSRNPPEYCHTKLMQYKTYGDGLTVHSSPYSVPIEYVSDLCVSMTHHFINHPDDLTDAVNNYLFTDHLSADAILFATKIKYIEGKIRYYSMQEQKISASEKLRYDKRYERIPEWADGSAGSVYRLTVESYFCGIRRILLMDKIHTVMEYPWMDYKKLYPQLPIDDDMRDFHSIKRALMVLVRLVRAEREKMDAMDDAERYTQHYIAKHAETETIAA